jgi:hypothetical protein
MGARTKRPAASAASSDGVTEVRFGPVAGRRNAADRGHRGDVVGAFGVSRFISVPAAAACLIAVTVPGSFRGWERAMYVLIAAGLAAVALVGTTIAPWQLFFQQSLCSSRRAPTLHERDAGERGQPVRPLAAAGVQDDVMAFTHEDTSGGAAESVGGAGDEDTGHGMILPSVSRVWAVPGRSSGTNALLNPCRAAGHYQACRQAG